MRTYRLRGLLACAFLWGLSACDFTPDFRELTPKADDTETLMPACEGEGILCTVAGFAGVPGDDGDGGPALQAHLNGPIDVAMTPLTLAPTGDVYIVDRLNHRIRRVDRNGVITTAIGTGTPGTGTAATGPQLPLNEPTGLTIGQNNHLYLADWQNARFLELDATTLNVLATFGGTTGFDGDGGPARTARFMLPSSVVVDPDGNLYVSDQGNQRIRKIDLQGLISTLAGTTEGYVDGHADSARFHFPRDFPAGKLSINTHDWVLYIADTDNNAIRRYNFFTGFITTVAGTGEAGYSGDGGSARQARLNHPTDVIFTEDHRMYIADAGNHVIREVNAFGTITTVAGTGQPGTSPDGTPALEAMLNRPMGIFFDEINRVLYIADTGNHQVKKVYDPY